VYALVTLWQLAELPAGDRPPEPEGSVVSMVRSSPGFIEGFWTFERGNGKSFGFIILETADHARDLKNAIEYRMETERTDGLQLEMIRVQEIVNRGCADDGNDAQRGAD